MEFTEFPEKGAEVKRIADGLKGEIFSCDPAKGLLTVRWHRGFWLEVHSCTREEFARDWELTGERSPVLKEFFKTFAAVSAFILVCIFVLLKSCSSGHANPVAPSQTMGSTPSTPVISSSAKTLGGCSQEPVAELTECVGSNDDGTKSDTEIAAACSQQVAAWAEGCQKCGGGDERTCEGKALDAIRIQRLAKQNGIDLAK